jgi:hypothetical protein
VPPGPPNQATPPTRSKNVAMTPRAVRCMRSL